LRRYSNTIDDDLLVVYAEAFERDADQDDFSRPSGSSPPEQKDRSAGGQAVTSKGRVGQRKAVRNILKKEHGYQFDGEDQVWWKRVNFAKARQVREETEDVAFQVATLIREEKGPAQKPSFSLGL
jgi:hypothetical protein